MAVELGIGEVVEAADDEIVDIVHDAFAISTEPDDGEHVCEHAIGVEAQGGDLARGAGVGVVVGLDGLDRFSR